MSQQVLTQSGPYILGLLSPQYFACGCVVGPFGISFRSLLLFLQVLANTCCPIYVVLVQILPLLADQLIPRTLPPFLFIALFSLG